MPFGALIGAAAGIGGALISSSGAQSAADTQAAAADRASQAQLDMYNRTVQREQPFVGAGTNSLAALLNGLGIGVNVGQGPGGNVPYGSLTKPFDPSQLAQTPGYQFALEQGEQAIDNTAAARGGVAGGNTLQELMKYGQGLASTTYQQQLANYMAQQAQQFSELDTLVGSGQNAAAGLGALGANAAADSSNALLQGANARAGGQVAGANALGSAFNTIGNTAGNFLNANVFGNSDPFGFNAAAYGASPGAISDPGNSLFAAVSNPYASQIGFGGFGS